MHTGAHTHTLFTLRELEKFLSLTSQHLPKNGVNRSKGLLRTGINKPSFHSQPKGIRLPLQNSGLAATPKSPGRRPFLGTMQGISHSSVASLCALFAWAEGSSVQPWWKKSCIPTASVRAHKRTEEKKKCETVNFILSARHDGRLGPPYHD